MGVLIDTNILIACEKGKMNLSDRILKREDENFFISVITASELLHGVHRAFDPGIRARRNAFVEGIPLNDNYLLPVTTIIPRSISVFD